jgi:hypothetical protein
MKSLRRTCAVTVLTVLLSVPVFAGQVNCPGAVDPPPPPTETTTTSSITTSVILAIVSLIG